MHRSRFMSDRAGRASGLFGFSRIIKLITVQLPVTCVLLRPTVLFLQLPIQRSSTLVGYNPRWKLPRSLVWSEAFSLCSGVARFRLIAAE